MQEHILRDSSKLIADFEHHYCQFLLLQRSGDLKVLNNT